MSNLLKRFFICSSLLLASCDLQEVWSDGVYAVYEIDNSGLVLGRKGDGSYHGRVDANVVAIGFSTEFIVALQADDPSTEARYYYIPKAKDEFGLNADEITIGPLDFEEFAAAKRSQTLPDFSEFFSSEDRVRAINERLNN